MESFVFCLTRPAHHEAACARCARAAESWLKVELHLVQNFRGEMGQKKKKKNTNEVLLSLQTGGQRSSVTTV